MAKEYYFATGKGGRLPRLCQDAPEQVRAAGSAGHDVADAPLTPVFRHFPSRNIDILLRFRLFDASGAGRLSLRDLRRAVKDTQLPISEAEMLGTYKLGLFGEFSILVGVSQ